MWINQLFGWVWISVGLISGTIMGMYFHNEHWMGGYGSHPRRLIRLGHISFLGLGILNILFYQTLGPYALDTWGVNLASCLFIVGAITMPLCCAIMAWKKEWYLIFSLPVTSLNIAVILTIMGLMQK